MRRETWRGALLVMVLVLLAGGFALTRQASLVPTAGAHTLPLAPLGAGTTGTATATHTDTSTSTPTATTTSTPTSTGTATATTTATPTGSGTPFGQPGITLSVSTAPPGGAIGVNGTGFAPNFVINFSVGGIPANTVTGVTTVSDASGNFSATIVVPTSVTQGTNTVSATDGTQAATASLTVSGAPVTATATGSVTATPGLSASIGSGPPGTSLTLNAPAGTFPAGSTATVVFQDPTTGNPSSTIATGTVNGDGSLSLSVTVPAQATAGAATLSVTAGTATRSTTFTVQPALSANPTLAPDGSALQINGSGFAPNRAITLLIGGQSASPSTGTLTTSGLGSFSATVTVPATLPAGPTTITAVDGANSAAIPFTVSAGAGTATATAVSGAATATATGGLVPFPTIPFPTMAPPTATPTTPPSRGAPSATPRAVNRTTAYFAEGYTGRASTNGKVSFVEVLDMLNPNPSPAPVTITYYIQGSGRPLSVSKTIAAHAMQREVVNADVGADKLVAASVTSPDVVAVTRTIDRAARSGARLDGSTTLPVHAPARSWGFPEGYTGITFQEYLTILTPTGRAAHVSVRLAPQAASAAGARILHLTVPALGRVTANIRALNSGNTARSVGMLIGSDVPIVPERVEYFGAGAGSAKFGATVSSGLTAPATALRIPYASSGGSVETRGPLQPVGDQAYVTILNPSLRGSPVSVTVGFSDAAGHPLGHGVSVRVPAGTRRTVTVNPALGTAPAGPLSIGLYASAPVEAEAAQYYGGSPNAGAHPGIALPALASSTRSVLMSSLSTRLVDGMPVSRHIYLYNPYSAPARVAATFYGPSGATVHGLYVVPAGGITSVDVNAVTQAALGGGPVGAELTITGGTGFIASAVGRTADGLSALEDLGVPLP